MVEVMSCKLVVLMPDVSRTTDVVIITTENVERTVEVETVSDNGDSCAVWTRLENDTRAPIPPPLKVVDVETGRLLAVDSCGKLETGLNAMLVGGCFPID